MDSDPSILTYYDTTLHQSDDEILKTNDWLSDRLLAFWFEYLTHEVFKDFESFFLFMDPNMVFMIRFSEDVSDLRDCLAPLKVEEKGLIFIPVNNNTSIESAGGSHWATLVFRRETGEFEYYDSYNNTNASSARAIATKILPLLDETQQEVKFVTKATPQQVNGFDCGLYVCTISEYLAKKEIGQTTAALNQYASAPVVKEKRKNMSTLIRDLKVWHTD